MPTITCPDCKTDIPVADSDVRPERCVRCPQCGVSIPLNVPATAQEPVAFPKARKDETLLGLSDAVKAIRQKRKKV